MLICRLTRSDTDLQTKLLSDRETDHDDEGAEEYLLRPRVGVLKPLPSPNNHMHHLAHN